MTHKMDSQRSLPELPNARLTIRAGQAGNATVGFQEEIDFYINVNIPNNRCFDRFGKGEWINIPHILNLNINIHR